MTADKETTASSALGRREMLLKAAAGTGFITLWLTGCGDSGGGGGGGSQDAQVTPDAKVNGDAQVGQDAQVTADGNVPDGNIPDANVPDAPAPDYACAMAPSISANHSHSITIPMGHLTDLQDRQYNIQGASGHPHTVNISAAQFGDILAGNAVNVVSSANVGGPHTHTLSWNC